jgi:hypothetical protein
MAIYSPVGGEYAIRKYGIPGRGVTIQVGRLKGFRLKCSELRLSAFSLCPDPSA